MDDATIYALSSGRPPAAIAVIRVSGPRAIVALKALAGEVPAARLLVLRSLNNPRDGSVLDEALVALFPAGSSVTGEDLVEFHLHGAVATVAAVERALSEIPGLRAAEPGEFTYRAFGNGKLDLVQVEGLSNLLRAQTDAQRRAALVASSGGLSERICEWQQRVLLLSATIEAAIDYSDEEDVARLQAASATDIARTLAGELAFLLSQPTSERLFDGVRVAIAGPPNAGKSLLFNGLIKRDAAIVSPLEGTTRDLIEAPVTLNGTAFLLVDMAGLRENSQDPIEAIGIDRARQEIASADIILWLGDDAPPHPDRALWIYPRSDMPGRTLTGTERLAVSAMTGQGLTQLTNRLCTLAAGLLPTEGEAALTRRQYEAVAACAAALENFLLESDPIFGAEHLRAARSTLDRLTGRVGTEEMLDALFANFCVGK